MEKLTIKLFDMKDTKLDTNFPFKDGKVTEEQRGAYWANKHAGFIDEAYDKVKIGPGEWYASDVWERIDPVGYGVSLNDYINSKENEGDIDALIEEWAATSNIV